MTVEAVVLQGKRTALLVLMLLITFVLVLQIATTTPIYLALLILDVLVSFQVC